MPHVGGELQKCGSLSTGQRPRAFAVLPTVLNELAMYIIPAAMLPASFRCDRRAAPTRERQREIARLRPSRRNCHFWPRTRIACPDPPSRREFIHQVRPCACSTLAPRGPASITRSRRPARAATFPKPRVGSSGPSPPAAPSLFWSSRHESHQQPAAPVFARPAESARPRLPQDHRPQATARGRTPAVPARRDAGGRRAAALRCCTSAPRATSGS